MLLRLGAAPGLGEVLGDDSLVLRPLIVEHGLLHSPGEVLVVVHGPEEEAGARHLQEVVLVEYEVDLGRKWLESEGMIKINLELLDRSLRPSPPVHHEPHGPPLTVGDEVRLLLGPDDHRRVDGLYHSFPEGN